MGSSQSKEASAKHRGVNRNSTTGALDQGKHNSADSKTPLTRLSGLSIPRSPSPHYSTIRSSSAPESQSHHEDPLEIDEQEGHSNVTRPPPPPRLRRLSELIDPNELTIDSHIRSPSGNLLAVEQFLVHPDRPKSIRERQEQIRERVRAASQLGREVESTHAEKPASGPAIAEREEGWWKWLLCGCFGRT
jgi:hypothetical protein